MNSMRKLLLALAAALATMAYAQAPGPDTLVIAQSVDADSMDPAQISSRPAANIAAHIWGALLETTSDGEIVPYLAHSYEYTEDGQSLIFELEEGLTCHDGEALTASDVAYSFNRAADPDNGFTGNTPGFIFSSMGFVDAEVVDELTVQINTRQYNPIVPGLVGEVYIHCEESYAGMTLDEAAENPVGSGPYQFVEWIKDDRMVIERDDDFALRQAGFETIVWRVVPEASTRAAELIAGNVDIVANVLPDQQDAVNDSGNAEVISVAGTRRIYVGFNFKDKFAQTEGGAAIQETAVRQAMNHAVDVETICAALLGVECDRATGLVNPPNDHPELEPYVYDPELAEQMLDEAGYPRGDDGVRFELTLQAPNGRYLNDANVALAVGQYLSDAGVETEVELLDFSSVFVPLIRQHDAGPLFLLGSGGATWNALYDMADLSAVDAGTNYTEWSNMDWFSGWDRIAQTRDDAEIEAIKNEMLEVFYNDPPWLMMYFQPDFYGVSTRIDWDPRRDEKVKVIEAQLR
ncbi:MAG: ABC transporter substrate-binding protein [Trueperaceae bacterium]